jgi:hypothetical protein
LERRADIEIELRPEERYIRVALRKHQRTRIGWRGVISRFRACS